MKTRDVIRVGVMSLAALLGVSMARAETLFVEAEDFQYLGDWTAENDGGTSGGRILRTIRAEGDAFTVVNVPTAGEYQLWVRARDYPKVEPGKRKFTIVVDGVAAPKEAGAHGQEGYRWELLDTRTLEAGDRVIALRDTGKFYARCDGVLLTSDGLDPNSVDVKKLAPHRVQPVEVVARSLREWPKTAPADPATLQEAVTIGNELVRVTFSAGKDTAGQPMVARSLSTKRGEGWVTPWTGTNGEGLFLLYAPDSGVRTNTFFPSWASSNNRVALEVSGRRYETSAGQANPYWSGEPTVLVPRSVRAISATVAEVTYASLDGKQKVSGQWSVEPGRRDVAFSVVAKADRAGDYSFGLMAFGDDHAWKRDEVRSVLMPPMFNFQRVPTSPVLASSSTMPHAVSIVQAPAGAGVDGEWSWMVAADPAAIPFEWPAPGNARYGFSLLNVHGEVRPVAFSPVLGLPGSKQPAGGTVRATFRLAALPGDWKDALEYASGEVFGVTDYREPWNTSLTTAALNLIELMKDEWASGWEPKLKGFYNIEGKGVVTQAAPLAVIEAAVLTGDEELWATRALPTLEYTLTRPSAHFATAVPDTFPPYVNSESIKLKSPSEFYGTAYWQGVHALLGEANPWIAELALKNGEVRYKQTNVVMPKWAELMGAYRLAPSEAKLAEVTREADAWIESDLRGRKTNYLGLSPFYNMQFYPYWWDLIDLYELTREKRYLDAAEECGFHTIAGQWSGPAVPEGDVTVHPGGKFGGVDHLWWRGDEQFRLGYPRTPADAPERKVPAWVVSQIGLGFEQPSTFFGGGSHEFQQIMMSNWAPHLLRLYEHTGREVFKTYARNTVIGRWSNYPGYYQRGFTDLPQSPRYPYEGPDVTSIYYHHIPPHLQFTLDWLVTEMEERTDGRIKFPHAQQHGYVWFANRVFGGTRNMLGEVFGETGVRLTLDGERVKVADKAINHLVGRSAERVWVILTNDAKRDVTAEVAVDAAALGIRGGEPVRVLDAQGNETATLSAAPTMKVAVPRGGLVALSFAAEPMEVAPVLAEVENGHVEQAIAGAWQSMHAFRIRSPFGKDALYVAVMGRPGDGATAELVLSNGETVKADAYPYEFSVYPKPMAEDLTFTLKLRDAQGVVTEVGPVVMKGTSAAQTAAR